MKKIDLACIIDDDQIYVYAMKKMIEVNNLCDNLIIFDNGASALDYLKPIMNNEDGVPDIILLDINMPVMDGWDFMEEFVKLNPSAKNKVTIYMISSSVNEEDVNKAHSYSEISDYIVKPITVEKLKEIFT